MTPFRDRDYIKRFQEKGIKLTNQRIAIYEALAATDSHPTADYLYQQVKDKYPMISLNTVYNTLEVLKEIGEISQINSDVSARFDANMAPHHHLVCIRCRKMEDYVDPELDRLPFKSPRPKEFKVMFHKIEFQGYCKSCQAEMAENHQEAK